MQDLTVDFSPLAGRKALLALSGGADSVALLDLLRRWNGCALAAAHFHHGIRGAEADADADFCRALCANWGIEYFEGKADAPAAAAARRQGLETAARELRYAFLRQIKVQIGADFIVLAHHMDDQAETVLMHLLRGAGTSGAAGMRRQSIDLFRPLLGVRKQALIAHLRENGIPWREDRTNAVADTPRNRLRLNIMPELEALYPGAVPALYRCASLAAEEDAWLEAEAEAWLRAHREALVNGLRLRYEAPPARVLLRRALRQAAGIALDRGRSEALCELASGSGGALQLSARLRAERTASGLYLLDCAYTPPEPVDLALPGRTELPGICAVTASPWDGPCIRSNGPAQTLDLQALQGAVLRTRRAGDRIRPLGMSGSKLLSDYLTDRRIERPLRETLPLVARGDRILWVVGVGIAAEAALRPGEAGVLLRADTDGGRN